MSRSEPKQQPQDLLESLQEVNRDFEAFVSAWTARLDRAIESSRSVPRENGSLQKHSEQLQREKQKWEAQRKVEQQAAQQRVEQLTSAWLKLESEQRAFLQIKATQQGPSSTSCDDRETTTNSSDANTLPIALSKSINAPRTASATSLNSISDSAAQQFQQLRREIDSSRTDIPRQ